MLANGRTDDPLDSAELLCYGSKDLQLVLQRYLKRFLSSETSSHFSTTRFPPATKPPADDAYNPRRLLNTFDQE
ncbi:hypothetical protein VHEMI05631 [[Torrubiella] hemipterigena]|uniref:Uncharacterized protein n=1 Tax=[Torrubiella] hemipterigena TaxID=1531966 RepID=A0A0A1TJ72_9HYPO|nr:hypothetical protein VHEMI05631 [[Torrubiella] hemipterigena]